MTLTLKKIKGKAPINSNLNKLKLALFYMNIGYVYFTVKSQLYTNCNSNLCC